MFTLWISPSQWLAVAVQGCGKHGRRSVPTVGRRSDYQPLGPNRCQSVPPEALQTRLVQPLELSLSGQGAIHRISFFLEKDATPTLCLMHEWICLMTNVVSHCLIK